MWRAETELTTCAACEWTEQENVNEKNEHILQMDNSTESNAILFQMMKIYLNALNVFELAKSVNRVR